ncbi:Crp/Fnr family transcriptional regulator [Paenibacillus silvae]|uniref:Crp/Fnr family transcriptional regulator n=1 Tax=Paenibacillus silvae TaxID=1325358 RepID=A0A2W6NFJ9_9BACL|nr:MULTISPECIES: Crp/Fnr family transcriptional regulator [Paenibacillus]MCK6076478.1 Crp/Fnr family transcriptional regulator [Paenibacillus silvae]MCK6150905.1 Crp/Fnr family transcriptional regulator [Paenibacillus silvae]MCK6269165.1 Crp/Fnr family transcriptional regulator [Paenibacillus silvae]PZT54425.1 Crp/Fnr family transcriptional regulator [Paenibacillus silvae]
MTRVNKDTAAAFLQQFPIFQDLSPEELKQVEEIAISRNMNRKTVIFSEGSEKEAVFFIRTGIVKAYKTDENGHEQIVSFLKTGDMFPHTGFFNAHPYPATAVAITATSLLAIPVRHFERLMLSTPSIAIKIMRVLGDKIRELQDKLQVLSGQDVRNRVLSFLLMLAEQHGQQQKDKVIINLPMTHQEFANSIGTTRETANRLLNQLAKDELLEVDRSRIIIHDLQSLKEQRDT